MRRQPRLPIGWSRTAGAVTTCSRHRRDERHCAKRALAEGAQRCGGPLIEDFVEQQLLSTDVSAGGERTTEPPHLPSSRCICQNFCNDWPFQQIQALACCISLRHK